MSSGAKQVIYLVAETKTGELPIRPTWTTLPFKTCSVDGTVNQTESDTITDGRIGKGAMPTSMEVGGDLEVNAAYGVYDALLEAAFFNTWQDNNLTVGKTRKSFSLVRGYTDINNYHIFKGMHLAGFKLDIPEEGMIGMTFRFAGLSREQKNGAPSGTINPATVAEELTNVGVGDITLDNTSLKGVACVTAFSFELDNNLKTQKCLGSGLSTGKQLEGKAKITGSFTVAWSPKSAEIYEKQFTAGKVKLVVPFKDGANKTYTLTLPVVTITGQLPSGSGDDVLQTTFNYTLQDQSPILSRSQG